MHRLLDGLDKSDIRLLAARAAKARNIIYKAMDTEPLRAQIGKRIGNSSRSRGSSRCGRTEFCDGRRSTDRKLCGST